MLVLSRKLNESIVIGDDIILRVVGIEKGIVKLGIEAPRDVSIIRNELIEDVKESNIAAAKDVDDKKVNLLSKLLKK